MPSKAKVFSSNSDVAALFHPWITTAPWLSEGAFLGFEMRTGRPVFMDFQLLKKLMLIHSTVVLIIGAKNAGKSALVKSLCMRLLCLQAGVDPDGMPIDPTARIHDRKPENGLGEYAAITSYMLGETVDLATIGQINLFDSSMGMTELDIVETAINIAETILNRYVTIDEVLAIQVGVHKMLTRMRGLSTPEVLEVALRHLQPQDVTRYYADSNTELFKSIRDKYESDGEEYVSTLKLWASLPPAYEWEDVRRATATMSGCFSRLLRGDYGKVFGGSRSFRGLLTDPLVNINWAGVTGKPGALLEGMMYKWDKIALDRGDRALTPRISIRDEQGSAIKNLMSARLRDEYVRTARAYETTDFQITQYPTDYTQVGEAGSELRDLGRSINKGIGIRFVGRQEADDDTLHEITLLGTSDEDAWLTTRLPVGSWGIIVPDQKVQWVRHHLLPFEVDLRLLESNSANERATERVPVTSIPSVAQRIKELGAITVGHELVAA